MAGGFFRLHHALAGGSGLGFRTSREREEFSWSLNRQICDRVYAYFKG